MVIAAKIEVIQKKINKFKKAMLTLGIGCILVIIVCNILLGNIISFTFIFPLFYFLKLRSSMGEKTFIKDVSVSLEKKDNIELIISNCEIYNDELFPVSYIINKNSIDITYKKDYGILLIKGKMNKKILLTEKDLVIFDNQYNLIELYIAEKEADKIITYISNGNFIG